MGHNPRLIAVQALANIIPAKGNGASLRSAIEKHRHSLSSAQDKGLISDICYGVCRHYDLLSFWLSQQLNSPIKASAWPIQLAMLAGAYELWFTDRPAHAIVNAYPNLCRQLKAKWAVGLVNAILRKAAKHPVQEWRKQQIPQINYSIPGWLWQQWRKQWGDEQALTIAEASNTQAPLTLRLNPLQHSQQSALETLKQANITAKMGELSSQAVYLTHAIAVEKIPQFQQGYFSVQDEAAQLPALLLQAPQQGRILDACAAPGGKTGQIAERFPQAHITAIDSEAQRLPRIQQNLDRIKQTATILCADAAQPHEWHDGKPFDAILIDAPCSATGIIRRQPDVKLHRRPTDIPQLVELQARILDALWPLLAPGGVLVYATCSILQQENQEQIQAFLDRHANAQEDTPQRLNLAKASIGAQLLPQTDLHDGFYLARLRKQP